MLRSVPFNDALDTLYEPNAVFCQFLGSARLLVLHFFPRFLSLLPLLVLLFL